MKIHWMCQLVPGPFANSFEPAMEAVRQANGFFPAVWKPTDGLRANPWAVGIAEVNAAQLAAVRAVATIEATEETEKFAQFRDLSVATKSRINSFCDYAGLSKPAPGEVMRDFFNRLVGVIEPSTIETLDASLPPAVAVKI